MWGDRLKCVVKSSCVGGKLMCGVTGSSVWVKSSCVGGKLMCGVTGSCVGGKLMGGWQAHGWVASSCVG